MYKGTRLSSLNSELAYTGIYIGIGNTYVPIRYIIPVYTWYIFIYLLFWYTVHWIPHLFRIPNKKCMCLSIRFVPNFLVSPFLIVHFLFLVFHFYVNISLPTNFPTKPHSSHLLNAFSILNLLKKREIFADLLQWKRKSKWTD